MPRAPGTLALAAAGAIALAAIVTWRGERLAAAPPLPVAFAHGDHTSVNCVECHHNFADGTGNDLCYACHKRHPEIAADTQAIFHAFCRGCHVERALAQEQTGPLRRCRDCHHRPTPPRKLGKMGSDQI